MHFFRDCMQRSLVLSFWGLLTYRPQNCACPHGKARGKNQKAVKAAFLKQEAVSFDAVMSFEEFFNFRCIKLRRVSSDQCNTRQLRIKIRK